MPTPVSIPSPSVSRSSSPSHYAGFGPRLVATLVDFVVLLPLSIADALLFSTSRTGAFVSSVLLQLVGVAYPVVMHARWGQTLGKMVARIRVVQLSGDPISFREALLRSSVDIVLAFLVAASSLLAMTRMAESEWIADPFLMRDKLQVLQPGWGSWALVALQVWVWGEIFVVLTNHKRRAIHDFIAGTVVTKTSSQAQQRT